jgi:hypothetical protein
MAVSRALPHAASADALMVALAVAHGFALIVWPSTALVALGVWWTSNTIAHNFIHRPFFRAQAANGAFALYLSVLLGIPQSLWRQRHLAHHAGRRPRIRWTTDLLAQCGAVAALWMTLTIAAPGFFASAYVPGYVFGLLLCGLHGHYEHARGTTSHYGRLYNRLLFNDGYHVEHHARPGVHWRDLPAYRDPAARESRWPAPIRFLERCGPNGLDALERLVLRSRLLQRAVVAVHARALAPLLANVPKPVRTIGIVGGGLFPRSAIVLSRLYPDARIFVIDASRANLDRARRCLGAGTGVEFRHARYVEGEPVGFDLLVIPLAYIGDRRAVYANPPAPAVIVHDWIWRRRGTSRVVAIPLLKRVNLVCR